MTWIGNEPVQRRARILSEGVTTTQTSAIEIAGGYTVGNIAVFVNGSRLLTDQFDDSDGYVITFVNELPSGTEWAVEDIQAFEAVSVSDEANAGTLVKRDVGGTFKVGAPTDPDHPARLRDMTTTAVVTGEVDSVTGNSFTASVQVMAFGSVGAGSLLVGLRYREDGDPNWTETAPTAVSDLGTYPVTVSNLEPNKTHQFQAFGRDSLNPETFVVGEVLTALTDNVFVQAPSVSVEGSPDDVGETPTITVSPFSVFGGSDTYVRSEVKVFQNGVEIWSNSNVVIGSPWTWVLPAGILVENASGYRVDVRHVGSEFGAGGWGQSSVFSTKEEFFAFNPSFAGQPFGGGFYAGANIIVNGQEYALVVAPRSQGGLSSGTLQWKTAQTTTSGTDSLNDGLANSNAMNNSSHPAAQFCRGLNINGHTDWYLPSRDELEICYRYLKPTVGSNSTSSGANSNSNPVGTAYTTSDPSQTSISIFQEGGGEDFRLDSTDRYWSSTQGSPTVAGIRNFNNGSQVSTDKTTTFWVRAVRKVAI